MRRFILAIVLLGAACPCFGTPSISSVSGTAQDGQTMVFNWAGMPSVAPIIVLYDDFEAGTTGVKIGTGTNSKCNIGQYSGYMNNGAGLYYASNCSVSGTKCGQGDITGLNFDIGMDVSLGANTSDYFCAFWAGVPSGDNLPGEGTGSNNGINWKITWPRFNTTNGTTDANYVMPTILGYTNGTMPSNTTGGTCMYPFHVNSVAPPGFGLGGWPSGTFKLFWTHIKAANCTDHNGKLQLWCSYTANTFTLQASANITSTQTWQDGQGITKTSINAFGRQGTVNSHPSVDDVYVATGTSANAFAFIANAAPYTKLSKFAVCTHTAWSANSATVTVHGSNFLNEEPIYFYAVDENGNVSNAFGPYLWGQSISVAPPADTTPPVITNVLASAIDSGSAVITWDTNELADSRVDYGLDVSYGTTVTDSALTASHSVALSGLTASTLYHFRVRSADASVNISTSTDSTFTTAGSGIINSATVRGPIATIHGNKDSGLKAGHR